MKSNFYPREAPKAATGTALPQNRKTTSHREAERRASRLAARIGTGKHFPRAFALRESDENALSELENLMDYACRPYADDDDVAEFLGHGIAFAHKTREGEELRARYNARTLTGGQSGRKTIGWVIEVGRTLFVISLYSAAKTNETETNDFTDALSDLVERHSVEHVITGPFTRLVRSKKHGMTFGDACERARTTVHAYGRIPAEVYTPRGRELFDRMVEEAVYDYNLTVDRLTRGAHAKLMNGEWAKAEDTLPSLGCYKFEETAPGARKPSARVIPDLSKIDLVRDFLNWGASDLTEYQIAEKLATKYQWGSEVLRRLLNDPKATVLDARNPDLVVRHLWRHLDLFETGVYLYEQRIPGPEENVRTDVQETWREIGRVKFLSTELDFGHHLLPEGRWVEPELIAKVREKRLGSNRKTLGTGRAASRHVERKPLTGFDSWSDETFEWRLLSFSHDPYQLARREHAKTRDKRTGRRLGWKKEEAEVVAAMDPTTLHSTLADAIVTALGSSGINWQRELSSKPRKRTVDVATVEAELATVRKAAKRAQTLYGLAAEIYAEDETEANRIALKEATKEKARAEHEIRELEAQLAAAAISIDVPGLTEEAQVQVNGILAALSLLTRTETKAPAALNLALRDHLIDLRASVVDGGSHVEISVYVSVSTDEGPALLGPVTCKVLNTRRTDKIRARREGVLERRFRDGQTLEEIRTELGFTTIAKVSRAIHDEFRKLGIVPSQGLRVAAIDCPIPETRAVIFAMIEAAQNDEPFRVPAGIDPAFASQVRATYSSENGWVYSWALDSQETQRGAIAAAAAAGDDGLDWNLFYRDVLPKITDGNAKLVAEDLVRGKRSRAKNGAHLAPIFERSDTWHGKATDRRVWVRSCPFCGTRTLDHPIRVPEVPGGLICSTCRRAPELPTVVYPEGYAEEWVGPRGVLKQTGESASGTVRRI